MSVALWLIAIIFSVAETVWFGNNWSAASMAEAQCDGIAIGIGIAAAIVTIWEHTA